VRGDKAGEPAGLGGGQYRGRVVVERLPPRTESLVPQPISPYCVSKLAAEQYCMGLNAVYSIEVAALRYFNDFGPRQDPNSQ